MGSNGVDFLAISTYTPTLAGHAARCVIGSRGLSVWSTRQRWRPTRCHFLSLVTLSDEEIWLLVQRGLGYATEEIRPDDQLRITGESLHDTGRVLSGMLDGLSNVARLGRVLPVESIRC